MRYPKANRILLVAVPGFGDALVATPVLRALRTVYPNAVLDMMVSDISACGSIVVFDHYEIFFARNSCTVTKTFLYRNDHATARGDKRCANWHHKIVRKLLVKARVMAEICTVALSDFVCFAYRVRQHIRRC